MIDVFHLRSTHSQTAYAHLIASRTIHNVSNKHGKKSTLRLHRIEIVWSLSGGVPQRIAILALVPYPFAPRRRKTRLRFRLLLREMASRPHLGVVVRFAIRAWEPVTLVMLT